MSSRHGCGKRCNDRPCGGNQNCGGGGPKSCPCNFLGQGPPTQTNPSSNPPKGMIYLDEITGDIYIYWDGVWVMMPRPQAN